MQVGEHDPPCLNQGLHTLAAVLLLPGVAAQAADVVVMSELEDQAVTYGKYAGRLETCKVKPPHPVKTSFLKFARSRGAVPAQLEILDRYFEDGKARVRGLKVGFSKEECAEKLETPEGKELMAQIKEWYALD